MQNDSGTATLSCRDTSSSVVSVGEVACGSWTLRSILRGDGWDSAAATGATEGSVVLERAFDKWSILARLGLSGRVSALRNGVGSASKLDQPRYDFDSYDKNYFFNVQNNPKDVVGAAMRNASRHGDEPSFEDSLPWLAPQHDYSLLSRPTPLLKFVVTPYGTIKMADQPVYEPGFPATDLGTGQVVFDPRQWTTYWPAVNYTDYKSALVGRASQVVSVQCWDDSSQKGFTQVAVAPTLNPIQPGPSAEGSSGDGSGSGPQILIRIVDTSSPGVEQEPTYVRAGDTDGSPARELGSGGAALFYGSVWRAAEEVEQELVGSSLEGGIDESQQQVTAFRLPGQEGHRFVDMTRATIASSMAMFWGAWPNYGFGLDYWSVKLSRGASLPLTSLALWDATLGFGMGSEAMRYVGYYMNSFIEANGAINMSGWKDSCVLADGFADYGRIISAFAQTGRHAISSGQGAWVDSHMNPFLRIVNYTMALRKEAVEKAAPAPLTGMVVGPAEHDLCSWLQPYFDTNAWMARGLRDAGLFLRETGLGPSGLASSLLAEAKAYYGDVVASINASIVHLNATDGAVAGSIDDPNPKQYLPLWPVSKSDPQPTPFPTMVTDTASSYANFRFWTELMRAEVIPDELAGNLLDFRLARKGAVGGITRWTGHLDDMPAGGYALAALRLDRLADFNTLLSGHSALYQSRGVFMATEQLGIEGSNKSGGFREYLAAPSERDVDFCVPSVLLPALMTQWALVYTPADADELWVMKGMPRRWMEPADDSPCSGGACEVVRAGPMIHRFGNITFSVNSTVDAQGRLTDATVSLQLDLTGFGYVTIEEGSGTATPDIYIRLRDPAKSTAVKTVLAVPGSDPVAKLEADPSQEAVLLVPSQSKGTWKGALHATFQ